MTICAGGNPCGTRKHERKREIPFCRTGMTGLDGTAEYCVLYEEKDIFPKRGTAPMALAGRARPWEYVRERNPAGTRKDGRIGRPPLAGQATMTICAGRQSFRHKKTWGRDPAGTDTERKRMPWALHTPGRNDCVKRQQTGERRQRPEKGGKAWIYFRAMRPRARPWPTGCAEVLDKLSARSILWEREGCCAGPLRRTKLTSCIFFGPQAAGNPRWQRSSQIRPNQFPQGERRHHGRKRGAGNFI